MHPWGDIGKILVFWLILHKKTWKFRVAFWSNFLHGKVEANNTSFATVCRTCRFIKVFSEIESTKVKIFNFRLYFLTLMEIFLEKRFYWPNCLFFFQNPCKISFKIVVLTLYILFHLKSGKIFFSINRAKIHVFLLWASHVRGLI